MLRGLVEVGHWAANSSIIEVLSKERRILAAEKKFLLKVGLERLSASKTSKPPRMPKV